MSAVEMTSDRGSYRVTWEAPHFITFDFDLLRAERTGDVTGEVTVRVASPDLHDHLHQARLTMTGTRSRAELANQLRRRLPGTDWDALVEGSCVKVLRAFREGEPAILLRDAEKPPDAGWLLPPLVLGRLPTILFGDGGTGKSWLVLAAALSIHTDQPLLGIAPTARRRVAYLDWELEDWEQRERMRMLVGDQEPDLIYRRCSGPLRDQVDSLRRLIRDRGIGFVVIDSIGPACGGAPEESAVALGFFEALRMLGVGALCVAHVNRAGDTDKPFGSAFWHNGARATWYVKQASGDFTVGLFNRKSNVGRPAPPRGYRIVEDAGRIRIEPARVAEEPELEQDLPLPVRMKAALRPGALPAHELAELLGAKVDSVDRTARRNQAFVKVPDERGIYRIGLVAS